MDSLKTFAQFPGSHRSSLHELSNQLYQDQQVHWPMLSDGVNALKAVKTRPIDCGDYSVRLQYNPKRIVSTGAKVDSVSISARRCFLCTENLPAEQQGVLYKNSFYILCNPMPIFSEHFTISHLDHVPQSLQAQFSSFLWLAHDLSPRYSVFYNGPKCGASAPDHMHFQASPAGFIPVEQERDHHQSFRKNIHGVNVSVLERYDRSVIILEGSDDQNIQSLFSRLIVTVSTVLKSNDEPMMNVIGSYFNGLWRIIIFLREKHRPDVYFHEGDAKVLISPAAVDIGGLVVTPLEKDFLSVDAPMIRTIYREVSISYVNLSAIIDSL